MSRNDDLHARMRRFHGEIDELFMELLVGPRARGPAYRAPADAYVAEDPPMLTVELDVAGADPDRIGIELDGHLLTVRGVRSRRSAERRIYHHAEIEWGPFERRLRLNVTVAPDKNVTAVYDRGILTISLPLAERAPERRVQIAVRGRAAGHGGG